LLFERKVLTDRRGAFSLGVVYLKDADGGFRVAKCDREDGNGFGYPVALKRIPQTP